MAQEGQEDVISFIALIFINLSINMFDLPIGRSNMFLNMTEDSYAYGLPEFCCFKCYIFAGTTNSTFLLKTQFVMTM